MDSFKLSWDNQSATNAPKEDFADQCDNILYADEENLESQDIPSNTEEDLNIKVHIKGNEIVFYHVNETPHDRKKERLKIIDRKQEPLGVNKCDLSKQNFVKTGIFSTDKQGLLCDVDRRVFNPFAEKACNMFYQPDTHEAINSGSYSRQQMTPMRTYGGNGATSCREFSMHSKYSALGLQHWQQMHAPSFPTVSYYTKGCQDKDNSPGSFNRNVTPAKIDPSVHKDGMREAVTLTKVLPVVVQPVYNQNGHITLSKQKFYCEQKQGHTPCFTLDKNNFRLLPSNNDFKKEWNGKLCIAKERKHVKDISRAFENLRLHVPKLKR